VLSRRLATSTGAGSLLAGYHAELPNTPQAFAVHGQAASWDNGVHWTDLGEVVRPNQSYAPNLLGGFEMGDGPLVLSPDGKYFYFYFPTGPLAIRRRSFSYPLTSRWRAHGSIPYWTPHSDRRIRILSHSRRGGGMRSVDAPPICPGKTVEALS
jgi:hypothetical protein